SGRVAEAEVAVVIDQARAQTAAETWLQDMWVGRADGQLTLPPSLMKLEPGDVVRLDRGGRISQLRIIRISEHTARDCEVRLFDEGVFPPAFTPTRHGRSMSARPAIEPRVAP